MFHSRLNLRHIKMVNVTQTTRKAAVQPSTSHSNMLCIRRAFAAQVQTKAAAREMIASTIHQKAVAEISTRSFAERRPASLAHSRSILSAIFRQIFSPSCSSVFLASSPSAVSYTHLYFCFFRFFLNTFRFIYNFITCSIYSRI